MLFNRVNWFCILLRGLKNAVSKRSMHDAWKPISLVSKYALLRILLTHHKNSTTGVIISMQLWNQQSMHSRTTTITFVNNSLLTHLLIRENIRCRSQLSVLSVWKPQYRPANEALLTRRFKCYVITVKRTRLPVEAESETHERQNRWNATTASWLILEKCISRVTYVCRQAPCSKSRQLRIAY